MFHIMFSLPGLYVIGRFIWPMPWSRQARIGAAVLVLFASQCYKRFIRLICFSVNTYRHKQQQGD